MQLVERIGKRAYPTEPGRHLVEHARRIIEEGDLAAATMRRYREGWLGRVRVGASGTLVYMLPQALRPLRDSHPGLEISINLGSAPDIARLVQDNQLDIALITLPIDQGKARISPLRTTPLREESLVAILPTDVSKPPAAVTPEYLASHPLVIAPAHSNLTVQMMHWLASAPERPRVVMELDSAEAIKFAVAAGLGVSILPPLAAAEGSAAIIVRPLRPPLLRTLALVQRRDKPDEPALRLVREALVTLGEGGKRVRKRSKPRRG